MSRESLYSTLWSSSAVKPYDEARESEVALRRFGPAVPAIEGALGRARAEDRPLRVLDFGCADGHTAEQILLPFAGSVAYHGCDVYDLDGTLQRMKASGFDAQVSGSGLHGMPSDWASFDVILALSCFQYIPDLEDVFAGLVSRLAPGGVFVGYFYDAAPLRRRTDAYFREAMTAQPAGADEEFIARLEPLARLFGSLRDASEGRTIAVPADVPELGVVAGEIPLQQFLIDTVLFAWAPGGASTTRIQWALAEMFLTGEQTYVSADRVAFLADQHTLVLEELISGPSGHLAVMVRA
ncbi:MAG: Methyltranfer dom protein [Actinomycetota bacterium]|jgi:SAM-dependent methyltransferase|nr:Methyltranfer dom protein [Actinomycetota bacterium]